MTEQSSLDDRHQAIRAVLKWFCAAKPATVDVWVVASDQERGGYRGVCSHGEAKPTVAPPPVLAEAQSAPGGGALGDCPALADLPRLSRLVIGQWLRVVVRAPWPGFLHVFNFGTEGDVAKLFGDAGRVAYPVCGVPGGKPVFLKSRGCTDKLDEAKSLKEFGNGTFEVPGKASGMPERIFVLVTRVEVPILASDLHDTWEAFDRRTRSVGGRPKLSGRQVVAPAPNRFLRENPLDGWAWGVIQIPVADQ